MSGTLNPRLYARVKPPSSSRKGNFVSLEMFVVYLNSDCGHVCLAVIVNVKDLLGNRVKLYKSSYSLSSSYYIAVRPIH